MFWGITLENGKVYSQIVEQSFHISMAALGFENLTAEPTTVMVESAKADFAICTLQAGKIPQQALDLNFTEGEEVKFFLEGNGGVIHLTGYLLESPREYEFDEDGIDELPTSEEEEDASSDEQDEEESENSASDTSLDAMEVVGSCDFAKEVKKKVGNEKSGQLNDANDDDNDDDDDDVSWRQALTGDLKDNEESSSSDDNDWNPSQAAKGQKRKASNLKRGVKKPISKTLIDLMDIADDSDESSDDEDWAPQTDSKPESTVDSNDVIDSQTIDDDDHVSGVSS